MPAEKTVAVRVDEATHRAWKASAAKAGVPLSALVIMAVEELMRLPPSALKVKAGGAPPRTVRVADGPTVDPAHCTARLRAGAYCRWCGAIHARGI